MTCEEFKAWWNANPTNWSLVATIRRHSECCKSCNEWLQEEVEDLPPDRRSRAETMAKALVNP